MGKGWPVTIAGQAYERIPKKKAAKGKRPMATARSQNKRPKLVGGGDYSYRYKGKTPFSDVGRHVGSYFGWGDLGGMIGHGVGRLMGSGDYSTGPMVKANVLTNYTDVAEFFSQGRANLVHHREYLGDIITSSTPGAFKTKVMLSIQEIPRHFPGCRQSHKTMNNTKSTAWYSCSNPHPEKVSRLQTLLLVL